MTNELMNRVQIDEITAGRDAAIAKWLEAYDSFHALTAPVHYSDTDSR